MPLHRPLSSHAAQRLTITTRRCFGHKFFKGSAQQAPAKQRRTDASRKFLGKQQALNKKLVEHQKNPQRDMGVESSSEATFVEGVLTYTIDLDSSPENPLKTAYQKYCGARDKFFDAAGLPDDHPRDYTAETDEPNYHSIRKQYKKSPCSIKRGLPKYQLNSETAFSP